MKTLQDLVPEIPVVFVFATLDPVAQGYADNLTKPGKSVTGILFQGFDQKRFELMLEMMPDARRILVPYDPDNASAIDQLLTMQTTAEAEGIELVTLETPDTEPQVAADAAAELPEDIDAIFLLKVWATSPIWLQAGLEHQIPVVQDGTLPSEYVQPMMAYGPDMYELGTQAARLASQVLGGTKAGDLPIENVEVYLTVDLGVAEVIGVGVSDEFLERADFIHRTDVESIIGSTAGSGACNASFTSPAGTNSICTTTACENLTDNNFASYSDKTDVDSCETGQFVGRCSTDAFDTYYYDGDPATLEMGCGFASGTWTQAEN